MSVIVKIDGQDVEWDTQPTKEDIEEFRRLSKGQEGSARVGIKGMKDTGQYMYQQGFEGLKDLAKLSLMAGPSPQEVISLKAQGFSDAEIKEMYSGGMKVLEQAKAPGVTQQVYPSRSDYLTRYAGAGSRAVTGSLGIGGIPSMFGYGVASEVGGDIAQALGGPRIAGEITAPFAGPVFTLPFVAKKSLESAVKASPEISGKIAQFQLGGTLDQITQEVPDLAQKLAVAERLSAQNPNFVPNLAQITESSVAESIIKRQIAREGGAAFKGTIDQAEEKTKKAAQQILARNFPLTTDGVVNLAKAEIRNNLTPALQKQIQINDAITNLGASLKSKKVSEQEVGGKLRNLYDQQLRAATDVKNGLYAKANEIADKRNLVVAPTEVSKIYSTIANDIDDPMNFIQSLPTKERALLSRIVPQTDELGNPVFSSLSASQVDGAIKSLNSRIFRLDGTATPEGLTEAARLKTIRSSLTSALGTVDDADYQNVLSIANQYYKNGFKPRFREGMGYELLRANQRGQVLANSEVVRKFMAKPENLDDFSRIYGGREDAYDLLKDGVYTMLIKDKGDTPSASDIQAFVSKYDEGLSKFPALKNELLNNQTVLSGLEKKALEVEKSKDNILAGVLGDNYKQFIKLGDDGIVNLKGEEFQDSINRALISATNGDAVGKREFNKIKGLALKDPDATDALRNYVVNTAAAQPNPVDFLKQNDVLVGALFKGNKKDYNNALDILRGIEISRVTPTRGVPVTSATPELGERALGLPVSSIFSKISNPILSGSTATAQIFSKFIGKQIEENKDIAYRAIISDPSGFKKALEKTGEIKDPKQLGIEALKAIDLSPLNAYFAKKGLKSSFVALQPNGEVVVDIDGNNIVMPIDEATKENLDDIRRQLQTR
jgi:hypothetical protein